MILDPTDEEESIATTTVTFAMDENGNLCGTYKSGGAPVNYREMDAALDIAKGRIKNLRRILQDGS